MSDIRAIEDEDRIEVLLGKHTLHVDPIYDDDGFPKGFAVSGDTLIVVGIDDISISVTKPNTGR